MSRSRNTDLAHRATKTQKLIAERLKLEAEKAEALKEGRQTPKKRLNLKVAPRVKGQPAVRRFVKQGNDEFELEGLDLWIDDWGFVHYGDVPPIDDRQTPGNDL